MNASFQITMRAKDLFFDRAIVEKQAGQARTRALSKAGAWIRRAARSRIRRRKRSSRPGESPSAHSKDAVATIKNILFFYDVATKSVVVGPVKLNMVHFGGDGLPLNATTVPSILERGGTVQILEQQNRFARTGWSRFDMRSRRKMGERVTRLRRVKIAARPFMAPALEQVQGELPDLWKNWGLG